MSQQNFKNHGRYIYLWHYITPTLIILLLAGSIITFINSEGNLRYEAILLILISVILVVIYWYARAFALRAQDRAIRAEENIRHFILSGKPLDSRLRMSQIIALRFASDEEFLELAKRAVEDRMKMKEIKMAIKNWRPDYYRV